MKTRTKTWAGIEHTLIYATQVRFGLSIYIAIDGTLLPMVPGEQTLRTWSFIHKVQTAISLTFP